MAEYTPHEEKLHALTHGAGFLVVIAGGVLLLLAAQPAAWQANAALAVYSLALLAMYGTSTLYHSVTQPKLKYACRVLDHCAIFLLIAGTYTPLMVLGLKSATGNWILCANWVLAALGIAMKSITLSDRYKVSVILYCVMGWLCVVCMKPLYLAIGPLSFWLLVGGGVAYTAGVLFYLRRKPYSHTVWHFFVLAGSTLQYGSVLILAVKR